jgi:two-component system LytT family sensor kinase
VIDNGQAISQKVSDGFGIGISNTKARLDAMFNADFKVDINESDGNGTTVFISIPFVTLT